MTAIDHALSGNTALGFDTSPIIYFVEQNPAYVALVREVLRRLNAGQFVGYSSVITLTETLTYPKRTGDVRLEQAYSAFLLNSQNLALLNTDLVIADTAADLRARYNLRTPDAIQLATAISAGCEAFLTNDLGLRRVTDLRVLALDALTL